MFKIGRKRKNDIKPLDAYELMTKNESNTQLMILDVRSPDEYYEAHIENAVNIAYNSRNFEVEIEKLDKNKKYLVYCHSGHRSSNAVKVMIKLGFTDIYNISGGIRKWNGKGLPLV